MSVTLGLVQMMVVKEKEANLKRAAELARSAKEAGAQIIALPEVFNGPYDTNEFASFAEEGEGPTRKFLSSLAKELEVILIGGSIIEKEEGRLYNTCFVYDEEGRLIHRHRKVHLFDIDVPGGQYFMESDVLSAGERFGVFETKYGTFGLAICFDIRFAREYMPLAKSGAQIVFVPAAFNQTTGPAHWETLFLSRALDQQIFFAGISPARNPNSSYQAYGHSIVTSPWGDIVTQLGDEEAVSVVSVELIEIEEVRGRIPVFYEK